MNKVSLSLVGGLLSLTVVLASSSNVLSEPFYKGKTMRFIVGSTPGGGYDTYTRAVSRHISKYIPGNPTPIVENMPGGATLIAANYNYNRAKPDGLTVGVWNSVFVLYQALGDRNVRIDARKVGWVGAPTKGTPVCAVMGFTRLKTLKDVLESKKPIKMGGLRPGSITDDVPKILNKIMGTNFEVVPGYGGTSRVRLAMQAREVDGACWNWESMRTTARAMLDATGDDKLIPFIIHSRRWADKEVKELPVVLEAIKDQQGQATYNAWAAVREFQTPFSVPPGTPKDRLDILREAFKSTLHDSEFLADAKKIKLDVTYTSGEEIERLVDSVLAISPKVKENLQFLVRKTKQKR